MSLFLLEIVPAQSGKEQSDQKHSVESTLTAVHQSISGAVELIEVQVPSTRDRIFVIVESANRADVRDILEAAQIVAESIEQVRLVGAELEDIKRQRPTSGYLVEWDIPEGITMDAYLARKKEKSPLYAQVPETTFQRTYVREDMAKCLCFYDAPDEAAIVRAREVVSTPIDRLHKLDDSFVPSND